MSEADAVVDSLRVVVALSEQSGGATAAEVHSFGYLACLLSMFDGRPASEWGYRFAATESGGPFSPSIAASLERLRRSRLVTGAHLLTATEAGFHEARMYSELQTQEKRNAYVHVACQSALAFPIPVVVESIREEPGLRSAAQLGSSRDLLDSFGIVGLRDHFDALSSIVLGNNLFVVATVWLTYLGVRAGLLVGDGT